MKANDLLQAIEQAFKAQRLQFSPYAKSHAVATLNWLKHHRVRPDAPKLKQVEGWLEAIYHLQALESYELAYEGIQVHLEAVVTGVDDEPLHELLGLWGYASRRLTLYEELLGKVPAHQQIRLIDGIAHTHHSLGNYKMTLQWCDLYCEELAQQSDKETNEESGRLWGLLGITHHAKGEFSLAIDYHQRRLALGQSKHDLKEQMCALGDLGIAYFSIGAVDKARDYHERQLALSDEASNAEQRLSALGSLGHVYQAIGEIAQARMMYQQLEHLAKARGDLRAECGAMLGLGNVARGAGQLDEAIAAYQRCLALADGSAHNMANLSMQPGSQLGEGQRRSEAISLVSLAVAYNASGDLERAWQAANRAAGVAQLLGSESLQAQALQVLGMVASSRRDYEVAIESWVEAIALFEAIDDRPNLGLALFNLGGVMVALGETEEGLGCWLRSLMAFVQLGLAPRVQTVATAIYGHLLHVVDSDFLAQPVTAERILQVLSKSLGEIEKDYGQEAVAAVVRCLVEVGKEGERSV